MMITFLARHKKKVSCALLSVFLSQIFTPLISLATPPGDGTPVSAQLSKYVDPFTGDFSYSIPLMTVPGPNGENYPINIHYRAGIQMNQEASWVGLGWDLNPGEITRNVNGVPDDWKGESVITKEYENSTASEEVSGTNAYGPLYFNTFHSLSSSDPNASMDMYQSNRKKWYYQYTEDHESFDFADYDNYYVSGAGIGGEMSPHLFEYASLISKDTYIDKIGDRYTELQYNYGASRALNDNESKAFSKRIQFRFKNEYKDFSFPLTGTTNPYHFNSSFKVDGTEDLTTQLIPAGNVVKYFTNAEIAEGRENQNSQLMNTWMFLDFQKIEDYTTSVRYNFIEDGIGAFQITTPQGYTYHYSLPVYTSESKVENFIFANDANLDAVNPTFNPYATLDNTKEYTIVTKEAKYATSWKLTAITGPDFEDSNADGVANVEDKGYWVAFSYGKWKDQFNWRFPAYGFTTTDLLSEYTPSGHYSTASRYAAHDYQYFRDGSFSTGIDQIYYLNSIQTSTHTAYFVKNIRWDAHEISGGAPAPKLKLEKIILVKNEDMTGINMLTTQSLPIDQGLSTSGQYLNVIDIGDYNYLKNQIDSKSLKSIEFTYDYSLCKQLLNNLKTSLSTPQFISYNSTYEPDLGYTSSASTLSSFNTSDVSSGKLTLSKINFLEKGNANVFPSYLFDYDKNNSNKNPNYNADAQDFWGYYKSDFHSYLRGHYTTDSSRQHTDAWSLKKIITPLGGELSVQYESDNYKQVGYNGGETDDDLSPSRTFLIYDFYKINPSSASVYFIDKDVTEFVNAASSKILSLPLKENGGSAIYFFGNDDDVTTVNIPSISGRLLNLTAGVTLNTPTYHNSGFYSVRLSEVYGGGIRVKSISLKDPETTQVLKQEYFYENGIATSEPNWFATPIIQNLDLTRITSKLKISEYSSERHALKALVGYTKTTVKNIALDNITSNGSITFQFNNYQEAYQLLDEGIRLTVADSNATKYGLINTIAYYDANENIIRLEKNNYSMVGKTEEGFFTKYNYSLKVNGITNSQAVSKICIKKSYNTMLTSKSIYEKGSLKNKMTVLNYDRYTGAPTQTLITDKSEGVKEIVSVSAYTITGCEAMGSKVYNTARKNILSATSKTEVKVYPVNELPAKIIPENEKVISSGQKYNWTDEASIRNYNTSTGKYQTTNSTNHWKPAQAYVFNGQTNDVDWKLQSEITLYDEEKNILETKSDSRYAATIYGKENRVIAQAQNSKYSEFVYSGFEDYKNVAPSLYDFAGELRGANYYFAATSTIKAHTGNNMVRIPASNNVVHFKTAVVDASSSSEGVQKGKAYTMKAWIHKDSPPEAFIYYEYYNNGNYVNTISVRKDNTNNIQVGDWVLATLNFNVPQNCDELIVGVYNTVSSYAYFDDFMFGPADAQITGYVNNPQTGWTEAMINNDGFATLFEYDAAGRITYTRKETAQGLKIVSRNKYNFAR
jgi:hypothetical protein